MTHELYKQTLLAGEVVRLLNTRIASSNHRLHTIVVNKKSLSGYDDKRFILSDQVSTLPYGHNSLREDMFYKAILDEPDWGSLDASQNEQESTQQVQGSTQQAQGSSQQAQDSSQQAHDSSQQAQDSLQQVQDSSQQAQGSTQQAQGSSQQAQDSSQQAHDSSQQAQDSLQQVQDSSQQAQDSSQQVQDSTQQAQGSTQQAQGSSQQVQDSTQQAQGSTQQAQGSTQHAQQRRKQNQQQKNKQPKQQPTTTIPQTSTIHNSSFNSPDPGFYQRDYSEDELEENLVDFDKMSELSDSGSSTDPACDGFILDQAIESDNRSISSENQVTLPAPKSKKRKQNAKKGAAKKPTARIIDYSSTDED